MEKEESEFYKNSETRGGKASWCKSCVSVTSWERNLLQKIAVMNRYGGCKCVCCGESNLTNLSIDHIHGGGNKHRKKVSNSIASWIIKNNYPEGFQVLCHNCNCARGYHGYCIHEALDILYG